MTKSFGWFLALAWLMFASSAWAASGGIIIWVEGADADNVRRELASAVPNGLTVQEPAGANRVLAGKAVKGSLSDAFATPRMRKKAIKAAKNALTKYEADAVLSARAKRVRGGGQEVRLVLVVRGQADPVVEESVTVGKDQRARDVFAPLLAASLQSVAAKSGAAPSSGSADSGSAGAQPKAAPAENEGEDDESETASAAPAPAADEAATAASATSLSDEFASGDNAGIDRVRRPVDYSNAMVVLDVGAGVGRRNFEYKDPWRGPLRNYLAPGVGMWVVSGQLYPLINTGIAVLKDVGFVGHAAGAFPFSSSTKDGQGSADGAWTRYAGGVHLRLRTSEHNPVLIGVEALYGASNFAFSGHDAATSALAAEVPAVSYRYVRGGLDVRAPLFAGVSLMVGAGYLHVLSAGVFTDRFPHAAIAGIDARVGAAYAIMPWLEAKLAVDYARFGSSMKPQSGDTGDIAGGALDQFVVVNAGISAMF